MAIDNLNYYSAWLPAGQQTDRYSSQPWCLRSKNLDIFSSSKSVKATAWSNPTTWDSDVIAEEWWLVLKTDWKVYERTELGDTLLVDPSVNFPTYPISYTWKNWTYAPAQRWTPTAMSVATEWWEWKSFVVFTERASYVYSNVAFTFDKTFSPNSFTKADGVFEHWYKFTLDTFSRSSSLMIKINNAKVWTVPINIYCTEPETTDVTAYLQSVSVVYLSAGYYYDAETDEIISNWNSTASNIPFTWTIQGWIHLEVPITDAYDWDYVRINLEFNRDRREWKTWNSWSGAALYIDINWWPEADHRMTTSGVLSEWDYKEYYNYLPIRERTLTEIWVYGYSMTYWMKWDTYQYLYKWISSWVDAWWDKKLRYDFVTDMGRPNDPDMDVIWLIVWNEQVYMIWNLRWDGYIIPCDLTWWVGTPYIAYGCVFTGVENIDYLLYLVWENRWISCLWVFNQQELVTVIGGNKENLTNDLVGVDEQYKFDWKIVNWRKNLILSTKDNRIFQYWQTYGGKGWSFIHQLPSNAVITRLKANWDDLEISYSITVNDTTTNYTIKYQDDIATKNYNTEWEAVYPIVLWNHILEKEESDLYTSFILPSAATKLEFWGMANHYHFWTFTSSDSYTFSTTASYKIKGTSWNYALKFIEKNANQYTFRLEWDLPVQTTGEKQIIDSENTVVINYSDFNHFRRIWVIETDKYWEWDFRFHNLNNKLELPKSHSLQIMVKGKGTANYTPELFSVDLVANQRERW